MTVIRNMKVLHMKLVVFDVIGIFKNKRSAFLTYYVDFCPFSRYIFPNSASFSLKLSGNVD